MKISKKIFKVAKKEKRRNDGCEITIERALVKKFRSLEFISFILDLLNDCGHLLIWTSIASSNKILVSRKSIQIQGVQLM